MAHKKSVAGVRPPWTVRRRIVVATLAFCASITVWLVVKGGDSTVHETIAVGVIGLAAATIGSYVFGAVWDDSNVIRAAGLDPYRPPYGDAPNVPPIATDEDLT